MLRSALLLCAAVLAALCFGCVPTPEVLPPQSEVALASPFISSARPAGYRQRTDLPACTSDGGNPNPFINKVYTLSSRYVPGDHGSYYPPSPLGVQVANPPTASPLLTQITSDLTAAYCAASSTFKNQLDSITAVFITCADQNNCAASNQNVVTNSWGYRENAIDQSVLQRTYIALSADLWRNGTLPLYSDFENIIYSNLLIPRGQTTPANLPITIQAADTSGTDSGLRTLTALAALAHEMGHIYWWKLGVEDLTCNGDSFWEFSWTPTPARSLRFHGFGVQQNPNSAGIGGSVPKGNRKHKDQVLKDYDGGDATHVGRAYQDLNNIYNNGYWASLFSTVTPDEDFIETYKLWALTSATPGLASLKITVPSYSPAYLVNPNNPVGFLTDGQSDLSEKLLWIQSCFAWP